MATSTVQADDGTEYEILSDPLGSGGQGTVHRGRRCADDEDVAIKRVADEAGRGADANREFQIALKVGQQPRQHLLAPLTWATDGDDLLLVMPLADRSLTDELANHPEGLPEEALLKVLRDITSGLVELQQLGIVHRDLKPHNVLLHDGRWQLADFGMSRDLDVRTATVTFQYGGTLPYWAPERWRGQPATHKSDLYALGCIAYELATGALLFTGDATALQYQHLHTEPPSAPVGPVLARWIMRLLDKEPPRRPQDAQAALATLPTMPPPAGALAAAALELQQHRQKHAATQGQALTAAEARAAERVQALADLADVCASAADNAKRDLPDLRWDDHTDVQRFHVDDIRLDFALWGQTEQLENHQGLVLIGDVFTVVHSERRRAANLVCENNHGRLHWYLDTVTAHPLLGVVKDPAGFSKHEFFTHYEALRWGGTHTWVRQRRPLSPEVIIDLIVELLQKAARP